jgi:VIT1/CCC1 family predicted Fe2+/Mn2+ transporter
MTKEEILKIIDQNRDVLTPENYLGILKNVDIFTEDEKKRIVEYLRVAKEMLRVNEDFMKKRSALLKKGLDELNKVKNQMIEQDKQVRREKEHNQNSEDSSEADRMLGSL